MIEIGYPLETLSKEKKKPIIESIFSLFGYTIQHREWKLNLTSYQKVLIAISLHQTNRFNAIMLTF